MMLVLSTNSFFDHEAEASSSVHQTVWDSHHRNLDHVPPESKAHTLSMEPPCRQIVYYKRKYMEDEHPLMNVSPVESLEERSYVLQVSLNKMRITDDPEAFLCRSVLINNLLRRLQNEILVHRAWPFMTRPASVSLAMPMYIHPDRDCKRLRLLPNESLSNCSCFYETSHCARFQKCIYEQRIEPSSSSSLDSNGPEQRLDEEEIDEDECNTQEDLDSFCPTCYDQNNV